jgi:fatty acid desaturase
MTESYAQWYQALDPAKKHAIRDLHRINPYWNLVGLLFAVLWVLAGALVLYFPSWLVRLPGYILMGTLIHGMANLMHEGIHGTLFRHKRWDRWYGFIMGAPALFCVSAYGVNHLLHHRHNRTKEDPDEFTNVSSNKLVLSAFYYFCLVFGVFLFLFRVPCVALVNGTAEQRRRVVVEQTLLLLAVAAVFVMCWRTGNLGALGHVWLIPLLFAAILGNVRGWAEHTQTRLGHPLTETRTVTSSRLYSFLNINLNYHLEHHLFPAVPWYNLPKVHAILQDDYRAVGASIYPSYGRFLLDAFRTGIHGTLDSPR